LYELILGVSTVNGLLVIDKLSGMTSRDAVDRAATWFKRRTRIGHAGTLDPLATGVLVVAVGNGTRLIEYIQDQGKTYQAALMLGAVSTTDDGDGEIVPTHGVLPTDGDEIAAHLPSFLGHIEQIPPAYSAVHVEGRRAYKIARRGNTPELAPRSVRIDAIRLIEYAPPLLRLEIECGKGTYIRAVGRDLGERLGCGAYIAALRRTRIGPFHIEQAISLDQNYYAARQALRPLSDALLDMPRAVIDLEPAGRLRQGQVVLAPPGAPDGEVAVYLAGEVIAIGEVADGRLVPVKVFPV